MKSFRLQSRAESKAEKLKTHEEYVKNFDVNAKNRNLLIAGVGSIFGLFAVAIIFYISIFYLMFESFKMYKVTKKSKYIIISVFAAVFFIVVLGFLATNS